MFHADRCILRNVACLVAAVACVCWSTTAVADEPAESPKQTVVYKTVGPTKIEADVFPPHGDTPRPVVIWIHGGALIMGSREGVPRDIRRLCREQNYGLVSIDYRLAPEVKLPAIIEDLKDFYHWLSADGAKQFHLDPARMVISGGSAGQGSSLSRRASSTKLRATVFSFTAPSARTA